MPSFFARRYLRQQAGRTERVLGLLILLLTGGIVAAYIVQSLTHTDYLFVASIPESKEAAPSAGDSARAPADASVANPFPDCGVAGWKKPAAASRYTPDNVHEKIDGRADLYLQFQMASLTFGVYMQERDEAKSIDVYWYDMGTPQNALGIFRAEQPEDAESLPIGRTGYVGGGAAFFIKGASYVQVLPAGEEADDAQAAMEIARRIAAGIEGDSEDRWADDVLPSEGRVKDSLEYLAKDAFELDFLGDVYAAEYETDDGELTLFVHRAADEAEAGALYDRYGAFFQEFGRIAWRAADASKRIVAGEVSDVYDVVFVKGRYVGGVAGADDLDAAEKAATDFYDRLDVQ